MSSVFIYSRALRMGVVCVTIVFSQYVMASTDSVLSLREAIDKTLNHHPEILQFGFQNSQLNAYRQKASLRKGLELEMELENFGGSDIFSGTQSAESRVSLSSEIELGFKRRARLDAASLRVDHLALEQEVKTLEILSDLTSEFIRCLSIQEKLEIAEANREISKQVLDTVLLRSKKGGSREADLLRAKVSFARAKLNYESTYQAYQRSRKVLASYWGESELNKDSLVGEFQPDISDLDFELLSEKLSNSPYSKVIASKKLIAKADAKITEVQSRPNIGWSVGIKETREVDESALVAGISIPIFSSKRNEPSRIIAQNEIEILDLESKKGALSFHQALYKAYSLKAQYSHSYQILTDEIIPNLELALLDIKRGYERGRYTYSELVIAQNDLFVAREEKIESAERALLSEVVINTFTGNIEKNKYEE